jgi:hypothetical protein
MGKYIAIFSDAINDVEISGFMAMTGVEVDSFEELASSINWFFTYPIGEEELEFSNGEDLLSRIEFREISPWEYASLKKLFEQGFGVFINEEFLNTILNEDSDDNGGYDDYDDYDGEDKYEDEDDDY